MHLGKVCPIFDRIVRRKDTWSDGQNSPNVCTDAQRATNVHHHAHECDLVQVVI